MTPATPHSTINLMRMLFLAFAISIGAIWAERMGFELWIGCCVGAVLGLLTILIDLLLKGIRLRVFSSATLGLLLGFFFATLLRASNILAYVPENVAWAINTLVYCFFGYLGMMLAVRSNRDEFALLIPYVRFRQQSVLETPLLVDTNIIIDGRIASVCASGFVRGPLVVPRFVLNELHRLADSGDPTKRERGRRGLAALNEMQLSESLGVTIHEAEPVSDQGVDGQLIQLARQLGARLVTNDSALCQVARLQNVGVLNLNELARTLQARTVAGDELEIQLVKEGRDAHQAVGYQADGTMVVVNHARHLIGQMVPVVVSSLLQTSAGRMIFAELRDSGSPAIATGR